MIEYQKRVIRGIEQYKEEIEQLKDRIKEISRLGEEQAELLINENKQLKKMLRKCRPWNAGYCKFCLCTIGSEPHKDDCEYVRLTGGAE